MFQSGRRAALPQTSQGGVSSYISFPEVTGPETSGEGNYRYKDLSDSFHLSCCRFEHMPIDMVQFGLREAAT